MPLQFYKPTPRSSGCAAGFSFNSKDEAIYVEFIKQVGWDDKAKRGTFKGGAQGNVKFSLTEAAGLLKTLEKGTEFTAFHKTPNSSKTTRINFGLYYGNKEAKTDVKGYSLSVVKADSENSETGGDKFLIGFTFNEGRLLIEYLKYALTHCFDAIYSEDKKRRAAAMEKKPAKDFDPTDPFADDAAVEKEAAKQKTGEAADGEPSESEGAGDDVF
jgi:hypothetical protein